MNNTRLHIAIRAAFAAVVAGFIAEYFHFNEPFWAIVTVYVLTLESFDESWQKGIHRIIGTLAGAIASVIIILLVDHSYLLFTIMLFLTGYIGCYAFHRSRYSYAWLLASGTSFLVMLYGIADPEHIVQIATWRSTEIILGVVVSWFFTDLLWPVKKQLKPLSAKTEFSTDENDQLSKHGIKVGLVLVICFYIWGWTGWYGMAIGLVSALLVIIDRSAIVSTRKAWQRAGGCLIGIIAGLFVMIVLPKNLYFLMASLAVGGFIFAYMAAGPIGISYVGIQGGVAYALTMVPSSSIAPDNLAGALERSAGILVGVIVALIISRLIWPSLIEK